MAIIQISRITHRKGVLDDLPQPLAGAELGWATDARRLFIGNGSLEDGAPVIGNTEILTEFSDILGFTTAYTYQGAAAGYIVQTGPTLANPITTSLQRRLDSIAIVTDFGARGDGVTDDTAAINRALFQLYCRDTNPQIRRALFFPAGVYVISDTLKIPPFARLFGEGAKSSIISFQVQAHNSDVVYAEGVLVSSSGNYYRSINAVPVDVDVTDTDYWLPESLPEYVLRTADSLQQVGNNIATNGATLPQSVQISEMRLETNQLNQGMLWENVTGSAMSRVTVAGPLSVADLTDASADTRAIAWASTNALVTQGVVIDDCEFSGFTYATETTQQVKGCTISNSKFDTLYQGAVLGGTVVVNGGANGIRIVQNTFDRIYAQGIVFQNVSRNASAYNSFYDVGNQFNGSTNPSTSIIEITSPNNISVGDMFEREPFYSETYPCIDLNFTNSMAMSMNVRGVDFYQAAQVATNLSNVLDLGTYHRTAGIRDVLSNDQSSAVTLAVVKGNTIGAVSMEYKIQRGTSQRLGTLTVVRGTNTGGTGFSFVDDYVENADSGVVLTAINVSGDIHIKYTTTDTGVDGSINYTISHFN